MKRVLVLGGAGNFGARIVRSLVNEPDTEVLVASRSASPHAGLPRTARQIVLDIDAPDFCQRLQQAAPFLVIHCIGPYQGQDYRVASAAIGCQAHYIDLADGRDFVADFAAALDKPAREAGCFAIAGASTLPALSSAVVDQLCRDLRELHAIDTVIAPGQVAPRGAATLQAVFSYLGRPVRVWEGGRWRTKTGWMDLRRVRLAIGTRWCALCDVPDLELFPQRHTGVREVQFHAALEVPLQHFALWALAALVRAGVPVDIARLATAMERHAGWFDRFAGHWGGMQVEVIGVREDGVRLRRKWELSVPAKDGPEIPCMAAVILARQLLRGSARTPGASTAAGMLELQEFLPEFERWRITTRITEQTL